MLTKAKIDELVSQAYDIACSHGFHEEKLSTDHLLMLTIGEVGEAVEAHRRGKRANTAAFRDTYGSPQPEGREEKHWKFCFETFIKDTVADELADVCIRLFDLAGTYKMDILPVQVDVGNDYFRENRSFCERAYDLSVILTRWSTHEAVSHGIGYIFRWAEELGIDLMWHIEIKMMYNQMRGYRHGKKY